MLPIIYNYFYLNSFILYIYIMFDYCKKLLQYFVGEDDDNNDDNDDNKYKHFQENPMMMVR